MTEDRQMKIVNRQGHDAVKSTCTPEELSKAIQALDLSSVPPDKRWRAIKERIAKVILTTTTDPKERAKPTFQSLQRAYYASKGIEIG